MPRRWTNSYTRQRSAKEREPVFKQPSYEAMANALVKAGKASPAILTSGSRNREDG